MSRNYVYEELNRFIRLSSEDASRAKKIAPILLEQFTTIADRVYADMETDPRAANTFKSQDQIEQHRISLREWMEDAFSGCYDADYYQARILNGQRHAEVALFPHFIFGNMTQIRKQIVDTIARADLETSVMASYIDTANRIIDLDLALTIQSYWDTLMISKLKIPLALSSGLAHEIRNPLNGIALNLSLLERTLQRHGGSQLESTQPILESIHTELNRVSSLTTEIMNFAKPIEVEPKSLSSQSLLDEILRLQLEAMNASNIKLKTELVGPDIMYADHDRLFQVILNLIANAKEALEHRTESKEITVHIDNSKGATTTIKISDNGCGMPPEVRDRIFDLYFTTKTTGTGLGMAIVQKIVEAHSGTIRVSSNLGEGSSIIIFLPRPIGGQKQACPHQQGQQKQSCPIH